MTTGFPLHCTGHGIRSVLAATDATSMQSEQYTVAQVLPAKLDLKAQELIPVSQSTMLQTSQTLQVCQASMMTGIRTLRMPSLLLGRPTINGTRRSPYSTCHALSTTILPLTSVPRLLQEQCSVTMQLVLSLRMKALCAGTAMPAGSNHKGSHAVTLINAAQVLYSVAR